MASSNARRKTELLPGQSIRIGLNWQPDDPISLAELVAGARIALEQLRTSESAIRRAAIDELHGSRKWFRVRAEDAVPESFQFCVDGTAEISYGGIETGGHAFIAEVSPDGQYLGYRID